MIAAFWIEFEKLWRRPRAGTRLLAMNGGGILLFLILAVLPWIIQSLDGGFANELDQLLAEHPHRAAGLQTHLFLLSATSYSTACTFFMTLVAGSVVSDEIGSDCLRTLFLTPRHRFTLWTGKVLAMASYYLLGWGVLFLLYGATSIRLQALHVGFRQSPAGTALLQAFFAYLVVDVTTQLFFALVATRAKSTAQATTLCLGSYFLLMGTHVLLWISEGFEVLPKWAGDILPYLFPASSRTLEMEKLRTYLMQVSFGLEGNLEFPLRKDLLGANLAWALVFFALGAWAFSRTESRPESS